MNEYLLKLFRSHDLCLKPLPIVSFYEIQQFFKTCFVYVMVLFLFLKDLFLCFPFVCRTRTVQNKKWFLSNVKQSSLFWLEGVHDQFFITKTPLVILFFNKKSFKDDGFVNSYWSWVSVIVIYLFLSNI
jgi:hypothetical protein